MFQTYRSVDGRRTEAPVRLETPTSIKNIAVKRGGTGLSPGDKVSPGDDLEVTVSTEDPAGADGKIYVGAHPKPCCEMLDTDCTPPSDHFTYAGFTGGQTVTLNVDQNWLNNTDARGRTLIAPGVKSYDQEHGIEVCNRDVFPVTPVKKEEKRFSTRQLAAGIAATAAAVYLLTK